MVLSTSGFSEFELVQTDSEHMQLEAIKRIRRRKQCVSSRSKPLWSSGVTAVELVPVVTVKCSRSTNVN